MYILEITCANVICRYVTCKKNATYKKNYMYFFPRFLSTFFENHRICFNYKIYNYSNVIC